MALYNWDKYTAIGTTKMTYDSAYIKDGQIIDNGEYGIFNAVNSLIGVDASLDTAYPYLYGALERVVDNTHTYKPLDMKVSVHNNDIEKSIVDNYVYYVMAKTSKGTTKCYAVSFKKGPFMRYDTYLYNVKDGYTSYEKGSFVSTIQAEETAYTNNDRNSDGYWYVKGAKVNTAPTTPGAFTQPSGTLEIGDAKVFTVGAASDAEGNLSKYIWEVSINNATYTKVGETASNNFTYTIPTATSLKMRVKAVDSAGLESAYRESSSYTVQPPQYYYDKFTAVSNTYPPTYSWQVKWSNEMSSGRTTATGKPNYSINQSDGTFTVSGETEYLETPHSLGTVYYLSYGSNTQITRQRAVSGTEYTWESTGTTEQVQTGGGGTYYTKGLLVQSGIFGGISTYPADGRHTDGYWYVRRSRVSQSIAPPSPFTSPTIGKKFKPNADATITFGASNAANLSLYEVDYRYNPTGAWTPLPYNNTLSRNLTITTDKSLKTLELRVRAKNTSNVYSDYVYSEPFEIEHNVAPTVSLTGPGDNSTLYENDKLNIAGNAYDADPDQAVTIYYQINNEAKKVLATNLSQVQIALSKQLTFKGGKLYDGDTVITGILSDGVAHKLKVWAEDSEKASSVTVEKSFYVVPNRAPLLSIDAVVPSGVVDADTFKISGKALDEDANSSVKVTRRINSGNPVEIYSGPGGEWEFDVSLAQLQVGENTIVVEVIDNYGAKTSKTIKLNKNNVETPILHSVARYKIKPPAGSAKGVLLFIERDEEMDLKVELSMTLAGEQEQYATLTPDNTAPMPNTVGIVEDTYFHEAAEPKDNIILKLSTTRPDATVNHKIHLISGAVE